MTDGVFVGTVLFPVVVALAVLAAFFYSLYRVVMHDEEFENNWKFYGHYVVVFVSLVALVMNDFFHFAFVDLFHYFWGF